MVQCNISPDRVEDIWNNARARADERGWGIHDSRYWKFVTQQAKQAVAHEGCQEMMQGNDAPATQSRALRGLLSSILSEYEAEQRGLINNG